MLVAALGLLAVTTGSPTLSVSPLGAGATATIAAQLQGTDLSQGVGQAIA